MEKEKELTDSLLPKEPKLGNLRASVAPTSTPKKATKPALKKETEKKTPTPKPRPLSGQQMRYAVDNLPKPTNPNENARLRQAWRRIRGYKRHFPHLDYSDMPAHDAPVSIVEGFVDDLGGQLGEEKGVETLKHVYTTLLEIGVQINAGCGDPWQLCISELPKIAKKELQEKSFLDTELKEIAILHPELCRPNVWVRVFLQTYNLAKEVSDKAKGRVRKLPDEPIDSAVRSRYADL